MAKIIYLLCTLTSLIGAALLFRSYAHSRHRLVLWSAISFAGLSLSNLLLLLDKTIFLTTADLLTLRLVVAFVAVLALLYGLMLEER